jgi:RNA polymerase sigma factor (sigma-70 family)
LIDCRQRVSYISNQMSDKQLEKAILTYWPQVRFRVSKSLGYSNPDWEDVSNEVFIGVLGAIRKKKFREESSIGTYIYSITTYKITDYLRNKYKNPKYPPYPVEPPDPADRLERKERTEWALKSMKRLKSRDADILFLHYFSDLTQKQISELFCLSPRTVCKIIKSAKMNLKRIMSY